MRRPDRPAWLWGTAIVLLALNLRVAVSSVGVVIEPLRADLAIGSAAAGFLAALPVLCFAGFGALAPRVVRLLGLDRTAVALLVTSAIGLTARALVDSAPVFLALSVVALAGSAVGNVILPALVKQHLPEHQSVVSAIYGAALLGGAAVAAAATVPIADAFGGWRVGVGVWALLALVTLVPWLPALRRAGPTASGVLRSTSIGLGRLARVPMAWIMAIFFGAQSAQAYAQFGWLTEIFDDAGLSQASAGAMLGLLSGIGIPLALALPVMIARAGDRPILPWAFALVTSVGWLGILWAPTAAPWLWAMLLGAGGVAFPWFLTMIGRHARTVDGTAALSAFSQSIGYLIAGIGPFGVGLLHDVTGDWQAALVALAAGGLLIGVLGTLVMRAGQIEDRLHAQP